MTKHRIAGFATACVLGAVLVTARTAAADEWQLTVAPYLWFVSMNGDITARGNKFDVDASFGDILDKSDSFLMLNAETELRNGRFAALVGPSWAKLGVDNLADDTLLESDLTVELFFIDVDASYRLADIPTGQTTPSGEETSTTFDVFAGFRYTYLETELDFDAGGSPSQERDWWDPILGAMAKIDMSSNWFFLLRGDLGGFGAGSDFTGLGSFSVGYRFGFGQDREAAVRAGYRALYQDYEDGSFEWDMTIHGPFFGLVTFWG